MNIKDDEFWEKFKGNEIVVNCETEEELEGFLQECEIEKITWCNGLNPTEGSNPWEIYASRTCLNNKVGNDGMSYGNIEYYESKKYEIIKFKDLSNSINANESRRISKEQYYMGIAKAVSKRSTCIRRQYGAVIVKDDRIVSTGYNGNPRGETNCIDIGKCYRMENDIPHGTQYETCKAVHAEQNAIINAREGLEGADLYLYGEENGEEIYAIPCSICFNMIKNAGIEKVINTIF